MSSVRRDARGAGRASSCIASTSTCLTAVAPRTEDDRLDVAAIHCFAALRY